MRTTARLDLTDLHSIARPAASLGPGPRPPHPPANQAATQPDWRALILPAPPEGHVHPTGANNVLSSTSASLGVHEFFAAGPEPPARSPHWFPPLAILIDLARHARRAPAPPAGLVLWIGRRVWPMPHVLAALPGDQLPGEQLPGEQAPEKSLLDRSVFIDADARADRVWAIDLALRSPGVRAIIADAEGLTMPESRRLQLAAQCHGVLALLARPPWEERELSAARTRWRVAPHAGPGPRVPFPEPAWTLELLRCKGSRPIPEDARRWVVRREHATGRIKPACDVGVPAHAGDRSRASA